MNKLMVIFVILMTVLGCARSEVAQPSTSLDVEVSAAADVDATNAPEDVSMATDSSAVMSVVD